MKNTITPRNIRPLRCIAATLALIFTLGGLLAPQVANAKPKPAGTFPYQSFVDNFVGPNSPLTYTTDSMNITKEKGAMILSDPAPVIPPYYYLGLLGVGKNGDAIIAEDTTMQVVVRLKDNVTRLGLYTRGGIDGNAYVCNLRPDGELTVGTFFGGTVASVQTDLDLPESDVVVEFATINDTDSDGNMIARISVRAWAVERPNVIYSTYWEDAAPLPLGSLGLGAVGFNLDYTNPPTFLLDPDADASKAAVVFYQFKLKIIPPTSNRR